MLTMEVFSNIPTTTTQQQQQQKSILRVHQTIYCMGKVSQRYYVQTRFQHTIIYKNVETEHNYLYIYTNI